MFCSSAGGNFNFRDFSNSSNSPHSPDFRDLNHPIRLCETYINETMALEDLSGNLLKKVDLRIQEIARFLKSSAESSAPVNHLYQSLLTKSQEIQTLRYHLSSEGKTEFFQSISNSFRVFFRAYLPSEVQWNIDRAAEIMFTRQPLLNAVDNSLGENNLQLRENHPQSLDSFKKAIDSIKEVYPGCLLHACDSQGRTLIEIWENYSINKQDTASFFEYLIQSSHDLHAFQSPSVFLILIRSNLSGEKKLELLQSMVNRGMDFSVVPYDTNVSKTVNCIYEFLLGNFAYERRAIRIKILQVMLANGFDPNCLVKGEDLHVGKPFLQAFFDDVKYIPVRGDYRVMMQLLVDYGAETTSITPPEERERMRLAISQAPTLPENYYRAVIFERIHVQMYPRALQNVLKRELLRDPVAVQALSQNHNESQGQSFLYDLAKQVAGYGRKAISSECHRLIEEDEVAKKNLAFQKIEELRGHCHQRLRRGNQYLNRQDLCLINEIREILKGTENAVLSHFSRCSIFCIEEGKVINWREALSHCSYVLRSTLPRTLIQALERVHTAFEFSDSNFRIEALRSLLSLKEMNSRSLSDLCTWPLVSVFESLQSTFRFFLDFDYRIFCFFTEHSHQFFAFQYPSPIIGALAGNSMLSMEMRLELIRSMAKKGLDFSCYYGNHSELHREDIANTIFNNFLVNITISPNEILEIMDIMMENGFDARIPVKILKGDGRTLPFLAALILWTEPSCKDINSLIYCIVDYGVNVETVLSEDQVKEMHPSMLLRLELTRTQWREGNYNQAVSNVRRNPHPLKDQIGESLTNSDGNEPFPKEIVELIAGADGYDHRLVLKECRKLREEKKARALTNSAAAAASASGE